MSERINNDPRHQCPTLHDTTGHKIQSYGFAYISRTYLHSCLPVCFSVTCMITLIFIYERSVLKKQFLGSLVGILKKLY